MLGAKSKSKAAEADRLLNDPTIPLDPARIWELMEEFAQGASDPSVNLHGSGTCDLAAANT